MLAVPFVLSFALWRLGVSRAIKACLVASIVLLLVMFPIMMRMIDIDMHSYGGLIQRLLALTVFVPIGVGAYELVRSDAVPSGIGGPHRWGLPPCLWTSRIDQDIGDARTRGRAPDE